jgi:hypothetical protein
MGSVLVNVRVPDDLMERLKAVPGNRSQVIIAALREHLEAVVIRPERAQRVEAPQSQRLTPRIERPAEKPAVCSECGSIGLHQRMCSKR